MATVTLFQRVKTALRYTDDSLEDEISVSIAACLKDLAQYGVDPTLLVESTSDELVINAVITYCRWQFDFENQGDKYGARYKAIHQTLALRGDYNGTNE